MLDRILARTRERLVERKRAFPLDRVMAAAPTPRGRRSFLEALVRPGGPNLIAEFKRRSPSRGVIREDLHPVRVAQGYEIAGAAALSVLTEPEFFGGNLDDLAEARSATLLPTLCKDFIVDPYQVWEAWYAGADAVLLIVAALSEGELDELAAVAQDAQLEALFEVHDADDLRRALAAGARIVGVNNRDLRTFAVDLKASLQLASLIPDEVVAVSESGIRTGQDIRRLREAGYDAFLVGESLMSAPDPGDALEALIRSASSSTVIPSPAPVRVKVCGLTSVEDALGAVRAGADAIGLVLAPGSPRALDLDRARRIARALPPFVLRVGVLVDAAREELARAAETLGLDLLQLHGTQAPESLDGLPRRVLKAVRVGSGFRPEDALRYEGHVAGLLLDSRDPAAPADSGGRFDWTQALPVRAGASSLTLAGGLRPENVADAIRAVQPDAVDVSSGVESAPGRKDPARVRAFVEAVRSTGR